jgi:hypothetical protein
MVQSTDRVTSEITSSERVRPWVRFGLIPLGSINVFSGLWAVLAPHGWYVNFPGWDPRLVAAAPPYNDHLAHDAGAGLLASGFVLLAAAWLADRRSVQLALATFLVFGLPHARYHAVHPAPGLTSAEDRVNVGMFVVQVVAALVLLAAGTRPYDRPVSNPERHVG